MDIRTDILSPNHGARRNGAAVDMLVLHYTGMPTAAEALERLCDPEAQVSAHYFVEEDGTVRRLVPEDRRAWHAGVSYWRGVTDVNSHSIGIEIVNPGNLPFPEAQMLAVVGLCTDILSRHDIPAYNVVGHSDIAPDRKEDPGVHFDWRRLADAAVGLWPTAVPTDMSQAAELLNMIGYDPAAGRAVYAFQQRFRPAQADGAMDAETAALIGGLAQMIEETSASF